MYVVPEPAPPPRDWDFMQLVRGPCRAYDAYPGSFKQSLILGVVYTSAVEPIRTLSNAGGALSLSGPSSTSVVRLTFTSPATACQSAKGFLSSINGFKGET